MVRYRFNEHPADARHKRTDTPFGDHFRNCHPNHDVKPEDLNIDILKRAGDIKERKISESIYIREDQPRLNTKVSSWTLL